MWGNICVKCSGRKGFVCEEVHDSVVSEGKSRLFW